MTRAEFLKSRLQKLAANFPQQAPIKGVKMPADAAPVLAKAAPTEVKMPEQPMMPAQAQMPKTPAAVKTGETAEQPQEKNAALTAPDDPAVAKPATEACQPQSDVIHPIVAKALSQQVGNEFYAAYTYYGAAGWFKLKGLDGFAKMAEKQAAGEIEHARKVFDHLITAGIPAVLPALSQGVLDQYTSVLQVCESILKHEKSVTASWRAICAAAMGSGDGATTGLAQWFLAEQLEEENLAATLRDRVKMAGDEGAGILTIDASLLQ